MRSRLLIVEDSFAVAELLRSIFQHWECWLADSVGDALGRIQDQDFHAVLTDIGLTDGPEAGLELIESIRQRGLTMPICVVSANAQTGIAERCLKIGANEFVRKPCQLQDLRMRVDRLLDSRAGARPREGD